MQVRRESGIYIIHISDIRRGNESSSLYFYIYDEREKRVEGTEEDFATIQKANNQIIV